MKILFLTNNSVSRPLIDWLQGENEITVFEEPLSLDLMDDLRPDLVVSYSYRHIIKQDVLSALPDRFVNLHISMLPFNRGADPNAWSFLDNTPKGVTIHYIDKGLDTGAIIAQRAVDFDEGIVTLGGSYATLQQEIQDLFKENWDVIRDGTTSKKVQVGRGSYHHSREFASIRDELMGAEGWGVTISTFRSRYGAMLSLVSSSA
ncbi:formyltransferase family protein